MKKNKIILDFVIPINPRSKKNSMKIKYSFKNKRSYISQSDIYLQYESDCGYILNLMAKKIFSPIDYKINLRAIYFRENKRRVDLNNLHSALCDILTKYHIIKDDNSNIIFSMDGSYVDYDKNNPRTEVIITKI